MGTHGIKQTMMSRQTNDGKRMNLPVLGKDSIYRSSVATEDYGTKTANITNMQGKGTAQYGDDAPQYTLKAIGIYPEVALEYLNIPLDIKMALLGWTDDGKGGYTHSDEDVNIALIIETRGLVGNSSVYYAFQNGELIEGNKNLGTDQAQITASDDVLTYSSMKPFSEEWNNGMKMFDASKPGFSKEAMIKEVFGELETTTQTLNPTK